VAATRDDHASFVNAGKRVPPARPSVYAERNESHFGSAEPDWRGHGDVVARKALWSPGSAARAPCSAVSSSGWGVEQVGIAC